MEGKLSVGVASEAATYPQQPKTLLLDDQIVGLFIAMVGGGILYSGLTVLTSLKVCGENRCLRWGLRTSELVVLIVERLKGCRLIYWSYHS